MKGRKGVRQSTRRPSKTKGQPAALRRTIANAGREVFDQARLTTQTYLTVPELCVYARFKTQNATWLWLGRNTHLVPKCRRGRSVTIRRRDYDRAVDPRRRASGPHA